MRFYRLYRFNLSIVSFGSRQLSFERMEKKKGLKRFKGFDGLEPFKVVLCVRELVTY